MDKQEERESGIVLRSLDVIEKPFEIFYEQIAKRNATGLASVEQTKEKQEEWFDKFYQELSAMKFIPAGRVLYGAGANTEVTFFNCYVCRSFQIRVKEYQSMQASEGNNESRWRCRYERFYFTPL